MRKLVLTLLVGLITSTIYAQIPNFAGTAGDSLLDGYTAFKFRPGINHIETYSTFQYGVGDHWAFGSDLYTGPDEADWGFTARYGNTNNKWFNFGMQTTPSFDLHDNFHFTYWTNALYLKGAITPDKRFFWNTNTWWIIYDGSENEVSNDEYLGYEFPTGENKSLTIMAGAHHDWKFNDDVDLAGGAFYTHNAWIFYLWGNDFLKSHPRVVLGIEFLL